MTESQKKWAASHDWYWKDTDHGVYVQDTWKNAKGDWCKDIIEFTDFAALKSWAGY